MDRKLKARLDALLDEPLSTALLRDGSLTDDVVSEVETLERMGLVKIGRQRVELTAYKVRETMERR